MYKARFWPLYHLHDPRVYVHYYLCFLEYICMCLNCSSTCATQIHLKQMRPDVINSPDSPCGHYDEDTRHYLWFFVLLFTNIKWSCLRKLDKYQDDIRSCLVIKLKLHQCFGIRQRYKRDLVGRVCCVPVSEKNFLHLFTRIVLAGFFLGHQNKNVVVQ